MTAKISVIIPVYKTESYLCQCIDSILVQTYTNLEIIIVNDGSPDNCGSICEMYASKDSRIIVIHKENEGVSIARNAGIDIASGDYLTFVDSDDWLEVDAIETLYKNLIEHNADIVCCGFYMVYVESIISLNNTKSIFLLTGTEQIIDNFASKKDIGTEVCGKLFKRSVWGKNRFPKGKVIGEDLIVAFNILLSTQKIVVCKAPKYYCRRRKSSAMNSIKVDYKMDDINSWESVVQIAESKFPQSAPDLKGKLMAKKLAILREMILNKELSRTAECKALLASFRQNYKFYIENTHPNFYGKIVFALLKTNTQLYKAAMLIYKWKNHRGNKQEYTFFE